MATPFDFLYQPDARDQAIFGAAYTPPAVFVHGEFHTVARFPKTPATGDGQDVEIDECRLPARFFRLRVLPGHDGLGQPRAGFTLTTGSGDEMARLCVQIAQAVQAGMLGISTYDLQY